MRFNFMILVWVFAINSVMQLLLLHQYLLGGVSLVMAVVIFLVHRIRVKRFKAYDESRIGRTFD